MVQLVVFVLVLALVYAIKAVVIARTHDELVQDATSFSWAAARPQDEVTAASWAIEEEAVEQRRAVASSPTMLRHAGA